MASEVILDEYLTDQLVIHKPLLTSLRRKGFCPLKQLNV